MLSSPSRPSRTIRLVSSAENRRPVLLTLRGEWDLLLWLQSLSYFGPLFGPHQFDASHVLRYIS